MLSDKTKHGGQQMLVKTLLNRVNKFKSFVFENVAIMENGTLEAEIVPRVNSKPICSRCRKPRPGYDTLPFRRFEFVPLWNIRFFFVYAMRRVNCPSCGIVVESVPWAKGKHELTLPYMIFLASWAKSLSWQEVAVRFRTSWEKVFCAVEQVVRWGMAYRDLSGITAIGIDEIFWKKGYRCLTLVYQINAGQIRLLWIGQNRTVKTLLQFFDWFGKERSALLQYVCSDMWKPYLQVIRHKAGAALNILDRFHIMKKLNEAVDKIRASEHRRLQADGHDLLKHSRWCMLKRRENLTVTQEAKLRDLLRYNLQSIRAYLLVADFRGLWDYVSPGWAANFLDRWITRVLRSRLKPLAKMARMIRRHQSLILNWFRAKGEFSSGVIEGLNNKAKVTTRKAYGFRTARCIEIALYHTLGRLPEPEWTHKFC